MKLITKITIGIGTAVALTLGAAVVSAQPQGYGPGFGMGQGMGFGPGHAMGQGAGFMHGPAAMGGARMGPMANQNPAAMADARSAYFKAELKITPAQESAWKPFADLGKQQAEAMAAFRTTMHSAAQRSAPESLDLRNQMMKTRQQQMEQTAKAFKDLYAVLTPEQKAIADQRFARRGGRG